MRQWAKSEINTGFHLLHEFTNVTRAGGVKGLDPQLIGFIHVVAGRVIFACIYHPVPLEIPVDPNARLFQVRQAVEEAIQKLTPI